MTTKETSHVTSRGKAPAPLPREIPILFSGPMVRAILDGKKTQTRRVVTKGTSVTNVPWRWLCWDNTVHVDPGLGAGAYLKVDYRREPTDPVEAIDRVRCRWAVGDRLWVRERMRVIGRGPVTQPATMIRVRYEADDAESDLLPYPARLMGEPVIGKCLHYGGYREASRLTLEVTGVRVERVQDISCSDIDAEGTPQTSDAVFAALYMQERAMRDDFKTLWDGINEKRGFGWQSNPWVWVVEFKRSEGE